MDSIQSFYNTDSKKLTQLNPPSRCQNIYFVFTLSFPNIHRWSKLFRQPGDISFFSRTDPIGEFNNISQDAPSFLLVFYQRLMIKFADCTFTSVSSDESKFLEDFMTFASDFGGSSKERASLTELTVCGRTGNLTRPGQEVQAACTVIFKKKTHFLFWELKSQVTSLASLPGQYGSGAYGQHQHRDKYPAKKRIHSYSKFIFAFTSHQLGSISPYPKLPRTCLQAGLK